MILNDRMERWLRKAYYGLSPRMRRVARRVAFWPLDTWEGLRGIRPAHVPPRGKIFIGSGDFVQRGREQLGYLCSYAGLRPHHAVLDVGSGIGRTAVALAGYLGPEGRYEGFDVVKEGVHWCRRHITTKYPRFQFTHVDLVNDLYNLQGGTAQAFRFPYPDGSFDVVFLFSVFTHMAKEEVQHYLREINRVLKPGGRCLGTYFLYTPELEERISTGRGAFTFPVAGDGFRLMDGKVTAANIAFSEATLRDMASAAGLQWEQQLDGYWKDPAFKQAGRDFQDIVVLRRQA